MQKMRTFAAVIGIFMQKSKKNDRIATLRVLIGTRQMSSQDELLRAMAGEGITVTQTTLSRYLKLLKVAKASIGDGKYIYVLPDARMYRRVNAADFESGAVLIPGFVSITFAGNIGVVKTKPGYASSVAYAIDNAEIKDVLGTIAGDDTVFLAIMTGADTVQITKELRKIEG